LANLLVWEKVNLRIRTACRFLGVGSLGAPIPLDGLNVFLISLLRIQHGASPILPPLDMVVTNGESVNRALEMIFAKVPYVVKANILLEGTKKFTGR
jgi:hypothetical protein